MELHFTELREGSGLVQVNKLATLKFLTGNLEESATLCRQVLPSAVL